MNFTLSRSFGLSLAIICLIVASMSAQQADNADAAQSHNLTGAEARKIIQEAGRSNPDWWDSVPLEYPDTMDLAGTKKVNGWQPKVKIGAYIHSVINPRQSMWEKGAKFMHHVVDFRKRDKARKAEAMVQLADIYFYLLCDFPRAAYWYEQSSRSGKKFNVFSAVNLAESYWYIGSEKMALSLLKKYGLDGRKSCYPAANLLAKMGHFDEAIAMAKGLARNSRTADQGMLAAANAYRNAGQLDEAIKWYSMVETLSKGSRYLKRSKTRARECISAVKRLMQIDMSAVPNGEYEGSAIGYKGPVGVKVTVSAGKITAVEITQANEDKAHSNFVQLPKRIVEAGELEGIDAVSGATITSEAILNASANAVFQGAKNAGTLKE